MKGDQLPYCMNIDDYAYFGPGILLYFFYAKKLIILVCLAIILYGIYSLVVNISEGTHDHDCSVNPGSIPFLCEWKKIITKNKESSSASLHTIKVWLAIPMSILWAIGVRIVRDLGRMKNIDIDEKLDSSSDYCIWMEGLPEGQYNEIDIVNFLNKLWKSRKDKITKKLRIKSVQIIYNTKQIRDLMKSIKKLGFELINMLE